MHAESRGAKGVDGDDWMASVVVSHHINSSLKRVVFVLFVRIRGLVPRLLLIFIS